MADSGYAGREGKDDKPAPFSFVALKEKSEICAATIGETKKVKTKEFLACVKEIRKVFDHFGSVFALAFADIDTKVETIEKRLASESAAEDDMFELMEWEKKYAAEKKKKMTDDESKQPSVTRAINRMCHVVELLYVLFGKLAEDHALEVSKGLKAVYPDTLAKIHGWFIKKSVGVAFSAVPARKKFIETLGSSDEELDKLVPDIVKNMEVIDQYIQGRFKDFGVDWDFS